MVNNNNKNTCMNARATIISKLSNVSHGRSRKWSMRCRRVCLDTMSVLREISCRVMYVLSRVCPHIYFLFFCCYFLYSLVCWSVAFVFFIMLCDWNNFFVLLWSSVYGKGANPILLKKSNPHERWPNKESVHRPLNRLNAFIYY